METNMSYMLQSSYFNEMNFPLELIMSMQLQLENIIISNKVIANKYLLATILQLFI